MSFQSKRPWTRRGTLLAIGVMLGLLLAHMLNPRSGELAAEDDMDATIKSEDRKAAPELSGASAWINTDKPVTMAELKGKIVLLDFWTFG